MIKKYKIDKLGAFGEGVSHSTEIEKSGKSPSNPTSDKSDKSGKVVFIKGALPGEVVLAETELEKKTFIRAKLIRVIEASEDRVEPPCPYFGDCGGCSLQHLRYEAQLALKRQSVEETLRKVGGIEIKVGKVVPSPEIYRYRNKLSFPVRDRKIGLYTENSHNVVDICDCMLQREWNRELISALRLFMTDFGFKRNDERNGIRHIVAREKGGSICIVLVTSENVDISHFVEYIPFENFVLYQNINVKNNNVILGDKFLYVGGKGVFPDFHPASFYQVNDGIESRLYDDVAACCEGEIVIDAYCGAGNLTLRLAERAKHVYGIEIVPEAVDEAIERAKKRIVHNVTFICGDCEKEFSRLATSINGDCEKEFSRLATSINGDCEKEFSRLATLINDDLGAENSPNCAPGSKKAESECSIPNCIPVLKKAAGEPAGTDEGKNGTHVSINPNCAYEKPLSPTEQESDNATPAWNMGKEMTVVFDPPRKGVDEAENATLARTNMGKEMTVVFDPPRKGVDESTLNETLRLSPKKIVYVSCNPATLARDLKILSANYTITSVTAYDMFPQTPHVETLVTLSPKTI